MCDVGAGVITTYVDYGMKILSLSCNWSYESILVEFWPCVTTVLFCYVFGHIKTSAREKAFLLF